MSSTSPSPSPSTSHNLTPPQRYDEAAEALESACRQDQLRARRFTWLRGLTFVAAGVMFAAGASNPDAWSVGMTLGALFLAGLVAAVFFQERVERRLAAGKRLMNLHRASAARCRRQWEAVPVPEVELNLEQQALAFDLDLLGNGSLMHLVCRTHTTFGREQLRDLLLEPATQTEIEARQAAVSELRDMHTWRTQFELQSMGVAFGQSTPTALSQWADAPLMERPNELKGDSTATEIAARADAELAPAAYLKPLAWLLPAALWTSLALAVAFHGGFWLNFAIIAVLLSFAVALWHTGAAFETLEHVTTSRGEVTQYETMFQHVTSLSPKSSWLKDVIAPLADTDGGPAAELARLGRITRLSSLRRAGFIQAVLYMIAQLFFLADLHLLAALQHWRKRNAGRVAGWFVQLGKVEAVASLAGLAFDNPQWTMPDVKDDYRSIVGKSVGHPLLRENERVSNDVEVGPPGTLLLVTGSNMSGKSTLLRSIGLNALLAQAGGPACASQYKLPPVRLGTSVRVHDSLADGVSFFMAELKRLKQVVDMSRQDGPRLLFLLDEILQGTNSAERQIAVSHVLNHLLHAGAIGAISTHDLELASLPELEKHCHTVHFRESLDDTGSAHSMTFDYHLRQGVATTTNALKLLELVGLHAGDLNAK